MKTIAITGPSSGVGEACAKQFLEAGWKVIGISRKADSVFQSHGHYVPLMADLSDANLMSLLKEGQEKHGIVHLDALLLNAAGFTKAPFEELTYKEVEELYRVNVFSCFVLLQWAKPLLQQGNKPLVLMISSVGGVQGTQKFPGLSAYSSSKAAQTVLAECLAEEWKDSGISVNVLALGSVNTPMLREAFPGYPASMEPGEVATYINHWMEGDGALFNGKIVQLSRSTP